MNSPKQFSSNITVTSSRAIVKVNKIILNFSSEHITNFGLLKSKKLQTKTCLGHLGCGGEGAGLDKIL